MPLSCTSLAVIVVLARYCQHHVAIGGWSPRHGAIARTATNIRSGAQTPMAGMIHALTLLLVLVFGAPLAKHIPLSVLAAILMVVAYNMGETGSVPQNRIFLRSP